MDRERRQAMMDEIRWQFLDTLQEKNEALGKCIDISAHVTQSIPCHFKIECEDGEHVIEGVWSPNGPVINTGADIKAEQGAAWWREVTAEQWGFKRKASGADA